MKVSIVIACKNFNPYLEECLRHCLNLDYPDYEIIVLPDEGFNYPDQRVKIIPTGKVTPPVKRNKILEIPLGDIIAFIDDDAYPDKDWLKIAKIYFDDSEIGALGGPGVTPQNDNLRQWASGVIYESYLVSDGFTYRYRPKKKREVDDYPSCNFLIRREIFKEIGGFKTKFWPGEDTFLCLEIIKKIHKKILYVPELIVYHHRRPVFLPHLKQVSNYALHRGYFAKRFPETSFKVSYFVPSLFVLTLILLGIIHLKLFFLLLFSYLVSVFLSTLFSLINLKIKNNPCRLFIFVFFGIILTHLTYGIFFLKGILARKLKEE